MGTIVRYCRVLSVHVCLMVLDFSGLAAANTMEITSSFKLWNECKWVLIILSEEREANTVFYRD